MGDPVRDKINDLIAKAIDMSAIGSGGEMLADQADKFIDLTIDQSKLMKHVRIIKTDNPKGELDRLNIGEPVTEKASENPEATFTNFSSSPGTTENYLYDPTFSKVEYSCVKVRSAFNLTKEADQANIEKTDFRDTIMTSFAKRMSTDIEYLGLMGDATSYAAVYTKIGRLLKANNGWYYLIKNGSGANLIDCAGSNVSKYLFSKMIKDLPSKYLMLFDELRLYVSPTVYQNYLEEISERATNLGDAALTGKIGVTAYGIPVERIPLISESMSFTEGTVSYTDGTFVLLCVPQNLIAVFLRKFDVYWEFKPRADRWENTTYHQCDYAVEDVAQTVLADDLSVSAATGYADPVS